MAAPPPYWKKKTRPCPFYSSGRCLFSDACNFVHTVKVNHEPPDAVSLSGALRYGHDVKPEMTLFEKSMETIREGVIARPTSMYVVGEGQGGGGGTGSSPSRPSSLRRSSSERRKRVVLMSPPRSPRLSGLLSALEDVIGPDVEEVEIEQSASEDEGALEEDEDVSGPSESVDVSGKLGSDVSDTTSTSVPSRKSTSLPYCQDSPASHDEHSLLLVDERTPSSSLPVTSANVEDDDSGVSDTLYLTSVRPRIPSPIITQHLDRYERRTTVLADNTLEVHPPSPPSQQHHHLNHLNHHLHQNDDPLTPSRSSRCQSTLELLTSPFASPALRMLSPQVRPISPVFSALQGHGQVPGSGAPDTEGGRGETREQPYADDDVASLETLESSAGGDSLITRDGSSRSTSQDSLLKDAEDDRPGSVETLESSVGGNLEDSGISDERTLCSATENMSDFLTESLEEVVSPQETERPSSDYFRTPKNPLEIDKVTAVELESLPSLPVSLMQNNGKRLSEDVLPDGEVTSSNVSVYSVEAEAPGGSRSSVSHSETAGGHSLKRGSHGKLDSIDSAEASRGEVADLRSPQKIEWSSSVFSHYTGHVEGSTHTKQGTPPLLSSSPRLDTARTENVIRWSASASDEILSPPKPTTSAETPLSPSRTGGREELKRYISPKKDRLPISNVFTQEVSNEMQFSYIEPESLLRVSSVQPAPIRTLQTESNAMDSPASFSDGPSPVSTEQSYSHTADTLVEPEVEEHKPVQETLLERRAKQSSGSISKRLTAVSVTSPTKELRDSYFPASLEKTVRPTPSPLYEDPQRSASSEATSSGASSPRQSWAELQRKSGVSQKVPFGFRQSLLVEGTSSLAAKLASQFTQDEISSRTSSTSSLGFILAAHPRPASRVDMLAGRARSTSPFAPRPSSYRHSIASQTSSAMSLRVESSANMPRSASQLEFSSSHNRNDSTDSSTPGPSRRASWMKPLRLSQVHSPSNLDFRRPSSLSQTQRFSRVSTHSSERHVRNASQSSLVDKKMLSSSRSSIVSAYLNDTSIPPHDSRTSINNSRSSTPSVESVLCPADSGNVSLNQEKINHHHSQSTGTVEQEIQSSLDLLSPLSGSMRGLSFDELSQFQWPDSDHDTTFGEATLNENTPPGQAVATGSDRNIFIPSSSKSALVNPTNITVTEPCHAVATPRPTLMFAIASDDPAQVERVLASGEARPNDVIGPLSALEFALTNDALVNKTEIVKTLLAYGADPSGLSADLRKADKHQVNTGEEEDDVLTDLPSENADSPLSKRKKRESVLNPAMKYYLSRAGPAAAQTSAALSRSDFRSLARMRFDFVGQDRALEHLYWVLGMHSQQPIPTPLVVLCCGPCGHGKSLLARKFGSLLEVPTHTVNMTVLKTSHDLWQCPSMSPYDPPSERTLAEFLEANEGKRCVVVLDEIDKNEDERTLWSLLAPWELGRCSIDAGRRHIDVRNVIWLGTSNIGQDLVFEHHAKRSDPDTMISKAEYRELMNALRPCVTERLGTSLMSRVTAVLPFVPFTHEEKLAIASEAILALGGECVSELGPEEFERLALRCIDEYVETDGARSLYRSVSTHLMEAL